MRHRPSLLGCLLLALTAVLVLGRPVRADNGPAYRHYANARYSYALSYPSRLVSPQGEPDNGDGQVFLSRSGDISLRVYGSNNALGESLAVLYAGEAKGDTSRHPKRVVTYHVLRTNWFVVSGFENGHVFYEKMLWRKDDTYATLDIQYAISNKRVMTAVTAKIAHSFRFLPRA